MRAFRVREILISGGSGRCWQEEGRLIFQLASCIFCFWEKNHVRFASFSRCASERRISDATFLVAYPAIVEQCILSMWPKVLPLSGLQQGPSITIVLVYNLFYPRLCQPWRPQISWRIFKRRLPELCSVESSSSFVLLSLLIFDCQPKDEGLAKVHVLFLRRGIRHENHKPESCKIFLGLGKIVIN